jgi:hypothetical protein
MKNRVINVTETKWKSILLRDDELWLSQDSISNLAKFEEAVNTPHKVKAVVYKYPLEKLVKLKFNESSEIVEYEYPMSAKNRIIKIKFNTSSQANEFGSYLGEQLQFSKTENIENRTKPLLFNSLYVLFGILGTYVLGVYFNDGDFDSSTGGSRKGRSGGAIIRLLYNTIGQTGILILGTIITLFFAYKLFQRYQKPAKNIIYTK